MNRIVIVGAGGHGKVVADMLGERAVGFVDDNPLLHGTTVLGLPVFASLDEIEHDGVIVAIGDNSTRRRVGQALSLSGQAKNLSYTAIHPNASIARSAKIGEGSMISAGAIVLPDAVIGRGVIVNTKASVDHDCVIGDFVHLAPSATLGGNVRIGGETVVGPGATIISNVTIGARVVIGAGAVVVRDLPDDVTAWGVPAQITSDRRSESPSR